MRSSTDATDSIDDSTEGTLALRPNIVLNRRYRLEKRIRTSPDVDVYLAYDALLHRPVTISVPSATHVEQPQRYEAFLYRNQVASALHHRNIVAILDIGEDHGDPFVVSEHFVGDSLENIIEDEAPFDFDDVAILVEQLARGLDHAHQRGIVHGNLSPSDVIIDAAGLAKITNLGMVEGQLLTDSGTRSTLDAGPYLPPELRGSSLASHALDVHAIAAIAYEMLVGHPPPILPGSNVQRSSNGLHHYVNPSSENPSVPERAGETVLRALHAHQDRTGLTAPQLSHAMTNWRSWANQPSGAAQFESASSRGRQRTLESWPSPSEDRSWQPRPLVSSNPIISSSSSGVSRTPARIVRWLFLAVVVLSAAAILAMFRDDAPQLSSTVSEVPAELDHLLGATGE